MDSPQTYCTFRLAGRLWAMPVAETLEVLNEHELTPVPHTPRAVRGLLNLRGQLVPVLDLRTCLFPEEDCPPTYHHLVVSSTPEGPVAICVEGVGEVLGLDDADEERLPDTVTETVRSLIRSVHRVGPDLVFVLHLSRAIAVALTRATRSNEEPTCPSPR